MICDCVASIDGAWNIDIAAFPNIIRLDFDGALSVDVAQSWDVMQLNCTKSEFEFVFDSYDYVADAYYVKFEYAERNAVADHGDE